MTKIKLIVVAGPTASGKSDLAIQLARRFDGEVISADSRQVYRGMDIGTGKVTKAEQRLAPHHLLDVASPRRQYTVAQWRRAARRAIRDIVRRGKFPIVCGGTGFWIDALVYDLVLPDVKPNAELRARLNRFSAETLFVRLSKLDAERAANIDRHNKRRLVRALEIIAATGQPIPARRNGSPYEPLYLAVAKPLPELKRRIAKRLDARLKAGMIAEAERLHRQGISYKRLDSFGLEYRWLGRYLQGQITRAEMRDGLLLDITHYAKRQMTWWHKNPDIVWVGSRIDANKKVRHYLAS